MRTFLTAAIAAALFATGPARADDPKPAPKATLRSADGKKAYDLQKLAADGSGGQIWVTATSPSASRDTMMML